MGPQFQAADAKEPSEVSQTQPTGQRDAAVHDHVNATSDASAPAPDLTASPPEQQPIAALLGSAPAPPMQPVPHAQAESLDAAPRGVNSSRPEPQEIKTSSDPFGTRPRQQPIQATANPFGSRPQPQPIQAKSNPFGSRPQPQPIQATA